MVFKVPSNLNLSMMLRLDMFGEGQKYIDLKKKQQCPGEKGGDISMFQEHSDSIPEG